MNHTLLERAKVFLQAHKNKSIWHRITTSLAAVVVFVTTYMLILPAITMERPTVCGLEEHTHTKACYASSLKAALHEHDASCYDANGSLLSKTFNGGDGSLNGAAYTYNLFGQLTAALE